MKTGKGFCCSRNCKSVIADFGAKCCDKYKHITDLVFDETARLTMIYCIVIDLMNRMVKFEYKFGD